MTGNPAPAGTDERRVPPQQPATPEQAEPHDPYLQIEHHTRPGVEVCTPVGEIDLGNAHRLREALAELERRHVACTVGFR